MHFNKIAIQKNWFTKYCIKTRTEKIKEDDNDKKSLITPSYVREKIEKIALINELKTSLQV